MTWSEEEAKELARTQDQAEVDGQRRGWDLTSPAMLLYVSSTVATRAVELVAARGGTMTAGDVSRSLESIKHGGGSLIARDLLQHISAQGARIAELEARRNELLVIIEATRRRSLEAANLERLIAEHGLPAAMRWLVDGEEPDALPDCAFPKTHPHAFEAIEGSLLDRCGKKPNPETWVQCGFPRAAHRWPCSPTCTHDDAATPGHSERVKERSEAFKASCQHEAPTFTPSGCGQCTAEQGRIVPLYSENYGGASPFHPSTEEDWDLSLVEEALAEKPDSAVSNGALYWRRRFLKVTDRLGWLDPETAKARRDEALDALRAAIRDAVLQELCASGAGVYGRERIGRVIDEVDPHPRRDACDEGAEAMRAACIAEARAFWEEEGVSQVLILRMIGRLEGATP